MESILKLENVGYRYKDAPKDSYVFKNINYEFEEGKIRMRISPNVKPDFIMELHKVLQNATGKQWVIDIVKGEIGETIADKEQSRVDAKRKNVSEYPLVKKILEEFKGAKIETIIRKQLADLEKEEAETEVSIDIASTYLDEEE